MSTTAGSALIDALTADTDRLCGAEPDVRENLPDSVHQMRVTTRRLRSVLRSYRRILCREPVDELRAELRWLAGLLGAARDAEVRADRFSALLDSPDPLSPAERSAPPAAFVTALVAAEHGSYTGAHRAVVDAFDSRRYRDLLDRTHRLITDPPLRADRAGEPAEEVFADILRRDFRRLRRLVRAEPEIAPEQRIEHLHEIRKAAKRLRYAAEAATAVLGDPAAQLARHAKRLQSVLGDHRDAIESLAALHVHAAAEPGYRRLCEIEQAAAARALEKYPAATRFLRHHALK